MSATRWYAVLVVAVVLGVVAIVFIRARSDAEAKLAQYLQALKAAGKPTSVAELAPDPIPAEDDAAPLYMEAAGLLAHSPGGEYDSLPAADPQALDTLRARVEQDAEALELVRQAAGCSGCRFDVGWAEGVYVHARALTPLHNVEKFLSCAAVAAAAEGDMAQAAERLRLGLVMSRHVGSTPLPAARPYARGMDAIVLRAAERVMAYGPLPARAAGRLSSELHCEQYARLLTTNAVDFKRCFLISGCQEMRRAPTRFSRTVLGVTPSGHHTVWEALQAQASTLGLVHYARSSRLPEEELAALKACEDFEKLASLGSGQFPAAWAKSCAARAMRGSLPGLWVTEDAAILINMRDEIVAQRHLLLAALAIEQCRAREGRCPHGLAAVRIDGSPVPDDPFSGKPMAYSAGPDGFTLYSVGLNLRDDGGMPDRARGDIVLTVTLPR